MTGSALSGDAAAVTAADETPLEALDELYAKMTLIRRFEISVERAHREGRLTGPFHSSVGQEAVAAGVCSALSERDLVVSTHRGHGHLIAKGADLSDLCAELWGRENGICGGRGGSMHLADMQRGLIGQNGIVGGSTFLSTGAALGAQVLGDGRCAVGFLGDGSMGQGVTHECLNLAAIWELPVILVVENNQYAHSFPSADLAMGDDMAAFARAYGIHAERVDGRDAPRLLHAAEAAVARAREGAPTFIEAVCYRWKGHNLGDADHLYRPRDEVSAAQADDPLERVAARLRDAGRQERVESLDRRAQEAVDTAIEYAEGSAPAGDPLAVERV